MTAPKTPETPIIPKKNEKDEGSADLAIPSPEREQPSSESSVAAKIHTGELLQRVAHSQHVGLEQRRNYINKYNEISAEFNERLKNVAIVEDNTTLELISQQPSPLQYTPIILMINGKEVPAQVRQVQKRVTEMTALPTPVPFR